MKQTNKKILKNMRAEKKMRAGLSILGASALLAAILFVHGPGATANAQTVGTSTEPVISSVSVASTTDTEATITWNTDEAANSQVLYGTTSSYGNSTPLDTNDVNAHSETITGLSPDTTYDYQVVSTDGSGNVGYSSGNTFMTTDTSGTSTTATSTAATTTEPVISSISVVPTDTGATVSWNTDEDANSQILYGTTSAYGSSTTLDTNEVMTHQESLTGLASDTPYYFAVVSTDGSGMTNQSAGQMFTTLMSSTTSTSTGSTTSTSTTSTSTVSSQQFASDIAQLESELQNLLQQLNALLSTYGAGSGWTTTSGTGTSTSAGSGIAATIDQNGTTAQPGSSIDFGGHNFAHEEQVNITLNGQTVGSAHADGGGNFSTGSISLPTIPGTYTYMFSGQTSGMAATATVTVQ